MEVLSAKSPNTIAPQMYALKQATKVQEKVVTKLLDGLENQLKTNTPSISGLSSQGIGTKLDIKA